MSILDNVLVSLQMTGLSRKEQRERAVQLLDRVGVKGTYPQAPQSVVWWAKAAGGDR
ncbi:hypothetical protein VDS59_10160 [Levilactobacillus brevis]